MLFTSYQGPFTKKKIEQTLTTLRVTQTELRVITNRASPTHKGTPIYQQRKAQIGQREAKQRDTQFKKRTYEVDKEPLAKMRPSLCDQTKPQYKKEPEVTPTKQKGTIKTLGTLQYHERPTMRWLARMTKGKGFHGAN